MPILTSNRAKETVNDLSFGQCSGFNATQIPNNGAELLENTIITNKGKATQRAGLVKVGTANSTTNKILGIFNFNAGSALNTLLRARLTKIQRLNSGLTDWTDITGLTTLTTGLTTNFCQAIDRVFILNGTDNVRSIDTSFTVTDEGNLNTSFPLTTFAEYATNNRVFASGSLDSTMRDYVWFSNTLAPQTWDRTLNLFKVRSGNGGKVTWLKMFKNNELIIYKNASIFVLDMSGTTPLTDWTLEPLSTVIGCPAGRTVCDIGNDHIYLANDGVRLLSRTTFDKLRVGIISEPIQDIIETINQDAIQNSCGWFENGLYILGIPVGTSTTPNKFLIWDSVAANRNNDPNSAWTTIPTDTWNLSCFTSYAFGDNTRTVVGGSALATSLCYKVLSGTDDDGTTIVQRIIGRTHEFNDSFVQKVFDPCQFQAQSTQDGVYTYQIDVDRTGFHSIGQADLTGALQTPFNTPQVTGGSEINQANFRTKFAGRGTNARLQISNIVPNTMPTFLEYTIYAHPFGGRI